MPLASEERSLSATESRPTPATARPADDMAVDGRDRGGPTIRVCFISPLGYGLYRPESRLPFGGAEVQTFLLARALSEQAGRQVSVLTTVAGEAGEEQVGALRVVRRRGGQRLGRSGDGRAASWPAAVSGYGAAFREMYRQFRSIGADVYLHAGAGVEVGAYALICRLLRKRFIYVVASSEDLARPCPLVRGPLRGLFPLGIRLAHVVLCRTEDQRALLRARYGRDGVVIRTAHPVPDRSTMSSREGTSRVLWVGRGHPLKQPDLFLELARRCPSESFAMVIMKHPDHDDLLQGVRRKAAQLPNLTLHEDVAWSQVERWFAGAKLFVNTSRYEGFPNTFVQAALYGVPIVSWVVDPDGVLTKEGLGLCAEGSFDRLVEAVEVYGRDAERWKQTSVRARQYAETHHNLAQASAELDGVIERLATGKGRLP